MRLNLSNIGHNFLVYDGVNLSDFFVVRTFDMPLLPSIEAASIAIDGKAGEWFASRKVQTRDIVIGLGTLNETKNRKDIMAAWFNLSDKLAKDKVCKLEIGNGLYVNALLIGDTSINTDGKWSIVNVTFRCFDPYIYGKEYTETLKSGTTTINVKGKCSTFPVINLTASSSTVLLTDLDTGDRIRYTGMASGTKIVVDMANYKSTVNGVYKAADLTVSDFWPLHTGDNRLQLTGATGSLTYREMYL